MTVVTINASVGFDMRELDFGALADGLSYAVTSSSFIVNYGDGLRDELRGYGLVFTANYQPVTGTITSFAETYHGVRLAYASGFSVSAVAIAAAVRTASVSDDYAIVRAELAGNDTFTGGNQRDYLLGHDGNDIMRGRGGNDALLGGRGNDVIAGGAGVDNEYGGLGNDAFLFNAALSAANRDIVRDFANVSGNNDSVRLENSVLLGIGRNGRLNADFFHVGTAAHDASDRVIYNKAIGYLYYDGDGDGAGAATLIGIFTNKPTLTTADFVVV